MAFGVWWQARCCSSAACRASPDWPELTRSGRVRPVWRASPLPRESYSTHAVHGHGSPAPTLHALPLAFNARLPRGCRPCAVSWGASASRACMHASPCWLGTAKGGERRRGGGPRPRRPVAIGAGVGRLGPAPGIIGRSSAESAQRTSFWPLSMPGPRLSADVAATDSEYVLCVRVRTVLVRVCGPPDIAVSQWLNHSQYFLHLFRGEKKWIICARYSTWSTLVRGVCTYCCPGHSTVLACPTVYSRGVPAGAEARQRLRRHWSVASRLTIDTFTCWHQPPHHWLLPERWVLLRPFSTGTTDNPSCHVRTALTHATTAPTVQRDKPLLL